MPLLADEYSAVYPDGTLHSGKPTAEQIGASPITDYKLTRLQVVPVGPDTALVTYIAEVEFPADGHTGHGRFAVGGVWVKQGDQWMYRYYQGTPLK